MQVRLCDIPLLRDGDVLLRWTDRLHGPQQHKTRWTDHPFTTTGWALHSNRKPRWTQKTGVPPCLHIIKGCVFYISYLFVVFSIPSIFFALLPSRDSGTGSQSRLFSPPDFALNFYRENTSALSSLADSHRMASTHASTVGALSC